MEVMKRGLDALPTPSVGSETHLKEGALQATLAASFTTDRGSKDYSLLLVKV